MSDAATRRRLVLLRHGLTAWNAASRWQGHADIELTETGHLHAKAAASALAAYRPARIVSSDLRRAAVTAQAVAELVGLTPSYDARLREIHVGEFSGLTKQEVLERFGHGPHDHSEHGGESEKDVLARLLPALREVAAATAPGETTVVVSHGAALRLGVRGFLGWPASVAPTLGALDNCGWIVLEESAPSTSTTPRWRLAAYNRVAPIS